MRWKVYCPSCTIIPDELSTNSSYDQRLCDDCSVVNGGNAYSARLALCKARVPPLTGLTVPRGEMTGLTLQSRLILVVTLALQKLDTKPVEAFMLCDSKVAISATKSKRALAPYFQNRVAEISDNMSQVRKYCSLDEVLYVESDISTKQGCTLVDLGPDSKHQCGPNFLSLRRSDWPVTAHFELSDIPDEELKIRDKLVFTAAARMNFCHGNTHDANPWKAVEQILNYSNCLQKVKRILARYLNYMV